MKVVKLYYKGQYHVSRDKGRRENPVHQYGRARETVRRNVAISDGEVRGRANTTSDEMTVRKAKGHESSERLELAHPVAKSVERLRRELEKGETPD